MVSIERRTVAIIGLGQVTAVLFGIACCAAVLKLEALMGPEESYARTLRDWGILLLVIPAAWTTLAGLAIPRGLLAGPGRTILTVTGILLVVAIGLVMGWPLARFFLGHGDQ